MKRTMKRAHHHHHHHQHHHHLIISGSRRKSPPCGKARQVLVWLCRGSDRTRDQHWWPWQHRDRAGCNLAFLTNRPCAFEAQSIGDAGTERGAQTGRTPLLAEDTGGPTKQRRQAATWRWCTSRNGARLLMMDGLSRRSSLIMPSSIHLL